MSSSPRPLRTTLSMKGLKPLACWRVIVGGMESSCRLTRTLTRVGPSCLSACVIIRSTRSGVSGTTPRRLAAARAADPTPINPLRASTSFSVYCSVFSSVLSPIRAAFLNRIGSRHNIQSQASRSMIRWDRGGVGCNQTAAKPRPCSNRFPPHAGEDEGRRQLRSTPAPTSVRN
jgi:hypothetical protein